MSERDATARPLPQQIPPIGPETPAPKRKRRRLRSQRGSIIRRKRSWVAMYRTAEGRQIGKSFLSKTEATKHLTQVLDLLREGKYIDARPQLFSAYAEQWLDRRMPSIKPNTWRTYATFLKKWINPAFDGLDVCDIMRADIRTFAFSMLEKKHLSGRTIKMMLAMLSNLWDNAIDDQVAQTNPAHRLNVKLPDDSTARHMPERDHVIRTFAQLDANPTVQIFLACAAMTGLRKGEVLGLWWTDIDWQKATIRVSRSLTRAKKEQCGSFRKIEWHWSTTLATVPPKSRTSTRTAMMPDELAAMLRRLRERQHNESPFLFQQDGTGSPLDPQLIYKALHAAQDAAGVPRFGFHGLRHRFASELDAAGASPAHVRDRLGHSSLGVTNRYTHDVTDGHAYAETVPPLFPFHVNNLLTEGAV